MRLRTKFTMLSFLVVSATCLWTVLHYARSSSSIHGADRVMPGDVVSVRLGEYMATGIVLSATERFDDKHGTYSCYRIDFGKLDNGESDIQTIPFRFVEKIKSPKAYP